MPQLVPGDEFPSLTVRLAGGGEITIPDDLGMTTAVLLFYRGHW